MGKNWCYPTIAIDRSKSFSKYNKYVKTLVYIYTTDKQIKKFAIGYMINSSLHINKVFIEQVEKC